ncbi:MAG: hypothetical protein E6Q97_05230 [Desulfurellales bacterium]|nr:MAG: hypothetical protein E6Q97_05230 [Desulfurellales bacterium]
MPVKVDPDIQASLEAMNLTLWDVRHPKVVSGVSEKTGKLIHRENKNRVHVALQGPGLDRGCLGFGSTLQEAVDDALASPALIGRVPGLKGSMMRLERAVSDLRYGLAAERFKVDPEDDEDVPF